MRTCVAIALGLTAAGCASSSADVQPSYVSALQYNHLKCEQLAREAQAISVRASQLAGLQDSQRTSDQVLTGVAVVVFWPAVFLVKGDNATTAELARLKGELDAIRQASNEKNCGIEFRTPEPVPQPPPVRQTAVEDR